MENKNKYYITTAIAYTSRKPHIGNSYEIVLADALARFILQKIRFRIFLVPSINGEVPLPTNAKTHFHQIFRGGDALSAYGATLCFCPFL